MPVKPVRLFVSFSAKDEAESERLFDRLKAQPVQLWDYSREGEEVPGGEPLLPYLCARIDDCDVFLPLVSPRSFASPHTCGEVRHAVSRSAQSKLRIIPLVLSDAGEVNHWPLPYKDLAQLRYYMLQTGAPGAAGIAEARASLEQVVARLCQDLEIEYAPLPLEDARLPFLGRFEVELTEALADGRNYRHPERARSVYQRLMEARIEATEALRTGFYEQALNRFNYFTALCEYELPSVRFYYPYLIKAVSLASLGQLNAAWDLLRPLVSHPRCDESLWGAMGYIKFRQESYREAMEYYGRAIKADASDPAAWHGWLLNALSAREPIDLDSVLEHLDGNRLPVAEDKAKLVALKAVALFQANRLIEAESHFEHLLARGWATAESLINFARLLSDPRHAQTRRAIELLETYLSNYQDNANYLHCLASICWAAGLQEKSIRYFRLLLQHHPEQRQFSVDAARVLWDSACRSEAKRIAAALLVRDRITLPQMPVDFYLSGFANWILGDRARAEYDFERSNFPAQHHYRHLLNTNPV
jgi:tetratricopeptide (TPR) repeat protein